MKSSKLEDIFPIYEIDKDNIVYTKNGDMAICLHVEYLEVFNIMNDTYLSIYETIKSAIRQLGVGYIVHKQDIFVEDKYSPTMSYNLSGDPIITANELHFKDRPFLNHRAYIYVILPSVSPIKRDSLQSSIYKLKWLPKPYNKELLEGFKQKISAFIQQIVSSRFLKIKLIDAKSLLATDGLLQTYFSLSFSDESIYDIDTKNGLEIANKKTATFVLNDLEQFQTEQLDPVTHYAPLESDKTQMAISLAFDFGLNLKINHIYNQILYIENQDDLKKKLNSDIRKHFSFSQFSRENNQSMEAKTEFIDTLLKGDSLAVKAHFNILTWADDEKTLTRYKSLIAEKLGLKKITSKVATSYSPALFYSCIPGNASELGEDNYATLLLDNAISLMNFESNYVAGSTTNGMLLTDRHGLPRLVDFFFEPMKTGLIVNRNFCIVGPSGSGKSVFVNQMITYLLAQEAHVTVVDIGHSYKRLGLLRNAKYITHSDSDPIKLNPFFIERWDLEKVNFQISEEFKEVIAKLIFTLYKRADDDSNKYEEVTINLMVSSFYKSLKDNDIYPNFNSFFEFVKFQFPEIYKKEGGSVKQFDIDKFLYVTKPFYKGGEYDYLLNSTEGVNYATERFVVYELDNIKDNTVLLPIITLLITNSYINKLINVRGVLKILLIEEAWSAVNNTFFAQFLLWAYKTARKHLGGIGVVTQEIQDLLKSPIIKEAIVGNAEIKIILDIAQYANQQNTILELFKLNERDLPKIFSINKSNEINPNRPPYRELALKLGQETKIYGNELSKTAYATFTTEATEVDQMKKIAKEKNISELEAAYEWANS